jgi:hypothetical protein
VLACRCYTFADRPSETTRVHLSAQQPVKLLAIWGASTPSTQKEQVVAFLQPLRGARLKRVHPTCESGAGGRAFAGELSKVREKGNRVWLPCFGWCSLFRQASCMSAIFPLSKRAKLQRRRLGARPMWSRSHACRPVPESREIRDLLLPDKNKDDAVRLGSLRSIVPGR